jgi:hypothetical protein
MVKERSYMDRETIRKHLAQDLPAYEIAPETEEEPVADGSVQAEANAGSIRAWRNVRTLSRPTKKSAEKTSVLMDRFRKLEL